MGYENWLGSSVESARGRRLERPSGRSWRDNARGHRLDRLLGARWALTLKTPFSEVGSAAVALELYAPRSCEPSRRPFGRRAAPRSRRHQRCAAPDVRHPTGAVAGRRGIAVHARAERVVEKARRSRRTSSSATPPTSLRDGSSTSGAHGRREAIQAVAFERSPPTTCPTVSSRRSPPTRRWPQPVPRTPMARTCARPRWTPRRVVTIRAYVAVDDIGNVVNPMIVEGQVTAGSPRASPSASTKQAVYDSEGNW